MHGKKGQKDNVKLHDSGNAITIDDDEDGSEDELLLLKVSVSLPKC